MEFNIEMANHPSWDRKILKEKKMNSFQLMEQENQGMIVMNWLLLSVFTFLKFNNFIDSKMISHSRLSFFPLIVTQIFTYHKKKVNLNFTANTSFKKKKKKFIASERYKARENLMQPVYMGTRVQLGPMYSRETQIQFK